MFNNIYFLMIQIVCYVKSSIENEFEDIVIEMSRNMNTTITLLEKLKLQRKTKRN